MKSIVSFSLNFRLTVLALFACTLLGAQSDAKLSLQGVLKQADGTAVPNGNYNLTFRLYTAATGGTAIYTEAMTNVPVNGGVYSAILGSTQNLDAPFDVPYYLSVEVSGQELLPRVPLTSAPTALSLIGSANKFPSSGPVGIGATLTNTNLNVRGDNSHVTAFNVQDNGGANNILTVREAGTVGINAVVTTATLNVKGSGVATLLNVEKSDASDVFTVQEDGRAGLNALVATATLNVKGSGVATLLNVEKSDNTDVFSVVEAGRAGINGINALSTFNLKGNGDADIFTVRSSTTNSNIFVIRNNTAGVAMVELTSGPTASYGLNYCNTNTAGSTSDEWLGGGVTTPFSMRCAGAIDASTYTINSDARIKNILGRSDNAQDLDILSKIKITDYKYKDSIELGNRLSKKVIAQELKAVYPIAVSVIKGVVPDIYQAAAIDKGRVALKTDLKPGERIKLIFEQDVEITEVLTADSEGFTVASDKSGNVFVYGREVDDFHTVDYDALTTLNISATQELLKRINRQQEQIDRQQERIGRLETQMAAISTMLHGAEK